MPREFSGVCVESHNRFGVEVVPFTAFSCNDGLRISGSEEEQVEVWIVRAGDPSHSAAVRHGLRTGPGLGARLTGFWFYVPLPLQFAGLGRTRLQVTGDIEIVAADTDDDVILHNDWSNRAKVILIEIT